MISSIFSVCLLLSNCHLEKGAYSDGEKMGIALLLVREDGERKYYLSPNAAVAFLDLYSEAIKNGHDMVLSSAYRTRQQQKNLRKTRKRFAARIGHSKHQLGIAFDIKGTTRKCGRRRKRCKTELFYWLKENAGRYGFVNNVKNEPWHWSFVGQQEMELDRDSAL